MAPDTHPNPGIEPEHPSKSRRWSWICIQIKELVEVISKYLLATEQGIDAVNIWSWPVRISVYLYMLIVYFGTVFSFASVPGKRHRINKITRDEIFLAVVIFTTSELTFQKLVTTSIPTE